MAYSRPISGASPRLCLRSLWLRLRRRSRRLYARPPPIRWWCCGTNSYTERIGMDPVDEGLALPAWLLALACGSIDRRAVPGLHLGSDRSNHGDRPKDFLFSRASRGGIVRRRVSRRHRQYPLSGEKDDRNDDLSVSANE